MIQWGIHIVGPQGKCYWEGPRQRLLSSKQLLLSIPLLLWKRTNWTG